MWTRGWWAPDAWTQIEAQMTYNEDSAELGLDLADTSIPRYKSPLPPDVLDTIASFLGGGRRGGPDLVRFGLVCSQWHQSVYKKLPYLPFIGDWSTRVF